MSLKGIKSFEELDDFIFENRVNIRCKEDSLFVTLVEPTEGEEGILAVVLSDGSQMEFPADQLDELFEVVQ